MGQSPPPLEWYHGSPLRLSILRAGSTITPVYDLARVFAHKPALVSLEEVEGELRLQHSGTQAGWVYRVVGVQEEDLSPHPTSTMPAGLEWLTRRELALELLGAVEIRLEEYLSPELVRQLQDRRAKGGA